ncbi:MULTISPECIES: cation:proton antiporter [unclassified Streptomyces]|uniref:cation:proton antiporter n=1 Tax=unclassified Streptomyces TaxID=2593676 RepID=UPI002DD7C278|nr:MULTISPECIES: cation:proton antiporter [unclassified Streptomyces]WSA95514.1 cation:proton antiporter [Streptomyces sp. NBC_01795]WSB79928.1 cation:proton antiporter [Streptomyces sp. NBC_01775]WSS11864.1 cation:proton antiporter [Streptomyces sp. NBC_01186]WSS40579.1 cation:proton antiporter [Streptomyces sp. NBC_01187]
MTPDQIQSLFIGLAAILALSRLLGAAARKLGQPPVVGEILAGILVGPTLFNGALAEHLFPADIRPMLAALANLGLVLFMFVIGYELDLSRLRGKERVAASVSLCSVLAPFTLGGLLALHLAGRHAPASHTGFVLFLGAAMSVTAFPVLARILADSGLGRTRVGGIALASAAIDDIVAWSLLAVVVTVSGGTGQWKMFFAPVYIAVMLLLVRPGLRKLFAARPGKRAGWDGWAHEHVTADQLIVVLGGLLLSCLATEWMGAHFVFGAFLFGVMMPRDTSRRIQHQVTDRFEYLTRLLLLPAFFVVAGLQVDLSKTGMRGLGELGLILLTAITGKFAGAYAGARLNRVPTVQSGVLATLMNTRGLTELVILTVGLQLGVISSDLYALMVVMALVTTAMAGPLLQLMGRRGGGAEALGDFEFTERGPTKKTPDPAARRAPSPRRDEEHPARR